MAKHNKEHGYDTVFIRLDRYNDVSSTLVREQISNGDYRNLPPCVVPLVTSKDFANLK